MYFFDKKTVYLVWNMQDGQARGVGTAKFLVIDEVCRIEVVITGCGKVQGTYPVYVLSGDLQSLLGEVTLSKGKGNLYIKCNTERLGHNIIPYKKVTGLHVDLKTEGYLEQKWLPVVEETTVSRDIKKERVEAEVQRVAELMETEQDEVRVAEPVRAEQDEVCVAEPVRAEQDKVRVTEPVRVEQDVKPPEKNTMTLYPNKWQQLCAIYPVVHPFQDGRAYLSIEPRDFVVLQERYQPMVQNSFLLHGFYHYRHLLLGRHQQGKNIQYYLGVPGVFYEKEKAAALFYGFESFEGPVTPAKEGCFGYYMKRVQI